MSLLEKLKDNQLFTKAQLPVVTYINEHSEEISKITIGQKDLFFKCYNY